METYKRWITKGNIVEDIPSIIPGASKRPVIVNLREEQEKKATLKKREFKVMEKLLAKKAKENSRANREEDMDYFATYYKEKCKDFTFKQVKNMNETPWRIE